MIPATVVATQAAPVAPASREYTPVLYGLIVVVTGFAAILIALCLVVLNTDAKKVTDPAPLLGMIAIAVAGLAGAFLGVALGLQGTINANKERAAAEAAKDAVQMRAERYLAYLEPSVAKTLVK
jgi:Co/Zn/Cd efflux system component